MSHEAPLRQNTEMHEVMRRRPDDRQIAVNPQATALSTGSDAGPCPLKRSVRAILGHLVESMQERRVFVDHSTAHRWCS